MIDDLEEKGESLMKNIKKLSGLFFMLLSLIISAVSAYVYEQSSMTVTQTIQDIATLTLSNAALGTIEEGQTVTYTPSTTPALDGIIQVVTTKSNVYLHLDSDLDSQSSNYVTYNITVKFDTVPAGSSYSVGDVACTLTLSSPDYHSITLDVAGTWKFDFEITTTPQGVSADTDTTVTITVSAESTSS